MNLYDLPYNAVYLISFKNVLLKIIKDNFVRIKFLVLSLYNNSSL